MKKKVIIISYYWPPSGGSGVQRWLKFAKYLPHFNWQPVIYTVKDGEFPVIDESLLNEVPSEIEVIKKPIWEPFAIYKKLTGKKKSEQFGHGFAGEKNEKGFRSLIKNFAIWIRGNYFIPDARKFWIKPSVKFLKNYIEKNNIEYLITTGPPHSLHLIGLELKKSISIKWIADFRDPWTGVYYFPELKLSSSAKRKHKALERSVLTQADKIISVGKTLKQNLINLAGENFDSDKIEVITNGFDQDISEGNIYPTKFNLVYTGLFSKDQNHQALWKAISNCCKLNSNFNSSLTIELYGKIDSSILSSIEIFGLTNKLKLYAHVSLNEIGKIQRQAAILLLCINHYPGEKEMLTGKLFDYLCSSRPILNIGPVDGDAAEIIKYTQTGLTFAINDRSGIEKYLLEAFDAFKENNLNVKPVNVQDFHRSALTKKLSDLLIRS